MTTPRDRLRRRVDLGESSSARRRRREGNPEDAARRTLGPYRLFTKLGSGPHGRVYLAIDDRSRSRVAMKVFRFRNESNVEPLMREFRLVASLKHPNILTPLEANWWHDRVYVAMPLLEASTLQEFQLSYDQAARIMVKVAEAIEAAHARGVLHRNLKPTNIFLNDEGEPLVSDFMPPSRPPAGPEFLSPEQVGGNSRSVGRACDVYGLGATLYYLLSQHLPFPGDTPGAIARKIGEHELVPPCKWEPAIPPALEAIVLKAMAHEPERRYASAAQFALDLRNWVENMPVAAFAERTRRRVFATVALAATIAIVVALGWMFTRPGPKPGPVATTPTNTSVEPPPDTTERLVPDADAHPPPPTQLPDPVTETAPPPPTTVEVPTQKPELSAALLAALRENIAGTHRHYRETYFLPGERVRLDELTRAGRGDADDVAFLRGRVLGEIGGAMRSDEESIESIAASGIEADVAHADALRRDPGNTAARAGLGYVRASSGFWRRDAVAKETKEGIEFEGRKYTRDALKQLLTSRGFVQLNSEWCKRRAWTSVPPVHGKGRQVTLSSAELFTVYDAKLETIHDPFSKVNVQVKRFTPKSHYYGAIDGEAAVRIEAPGDLVECTVRAASKIVGEGTVEVWLVVDATGVSLRLYELTTGRNEEFIDISSQVKGKRAFTIVAKLKSRDEGRERRAARFLPSESAEGVPLEVRGVVGEPQPGLAKLLGAESTGRSTEDVRRLVVAIAERFVREETLFSESLVKVRAEASMLKYDGVLETPMEYEGIGRAIGDPLTYDFEKQDAKLVTWWSEQTVAKRRAFATWFGLWCAQEAARR